jgi:BirA family biotin operon repressor/biotin-[acetyl-CoA-carboxylase] ligase
MRLDPAAAAAGFRLSAHDTLASTNAEALTRACGGDNGPLWVTARQQTAGRGRRGNEWVSTPGNLYATLLVSDPAAAEDAPQLSFVAGLAAYDAIVACAPDMRGDLALKWPNDILHRMQKLAGILIESETIGSRLAVVIGIGVNCMHHPVATAFPATDIASAGTTVTAEDLFAALSGALPQRLAQWRRGKNFAVIRAAWLERATGIGGDMRVRLPGREFSGRCEALDERGRLLLRLPDGGLQVIAAGDVFPAAAAERSAP